MPLESVMLCLDNSEWMRNGDFVPTRIDQQFDAFARISDAKMRHPESMVGLMTMSGSSPKVLVTPSTDIGKLLGSLHGKVRYEGEANVVSSLQIAQLALKHRMHKNHAPRIILFVASPIQEAEDKLVKLGKQLQKNEVAVDVVNFGEEQENTAKLEAFLEAVNKNDNSHLVNVPPGVGILSDILSQSPILSGGDGGGGSNLNEFGVDPELDPDLAMAMAMSMEEARRAEEGAVNNATEESGTAAAAVTPGFVEDDDAELQAALAMSMEGIGEETAPEAAPAAPEPPAAPVKAPQEAPVTTEDPAVDPFTDPSFVSDALSDLEGVDPDIMNDPQIKAMMEGLGEDNKDKDDEKK